MTTHYRIRLRLQNKMLLGGGKGHKYKNLTSQLKFITFFLPNKYADVQTKVSWLV